MDSTRMSQNVSKNELSSHTDLTNSSAEERKASAPRFDVQKVQSLSVPKVVPNEEKTHTIHLYEDDILEGMTAAKKAQDTIAPKDETKSKKANLGTFFGVFLPCCQNIVGVIYFVRFPWIIGVGGIFHACLIVGLCNLMSITTAISMSAIATNGRVTAGGTYFMISRSLGPTYGGSVGILFFIGTSISVAMYYLGTMEILMMNIAPQIKIFTGEGEAVRNNYRIYGTVLVFIMGTIVFLGVRIVSIFASIAIFFLVLAILSIFSGLFFTSVGVTWPDLEKPAMMCIIGDRPVKFDLANTDGVWHCNKLPEGKIYQSYCNPDCTNYFNSSEVKLVKAIPGIQWRLLKENWGDQYSEEVHQWPNSPNEKVDLSRDLVTDIATTFVFLFALYFPSITGVESGSNYSGDLKDPNTAIPKGTLSAVAVTSIMYFSSVILQGGACEGAFLRDKYGQSLATEGLNIVSVMAWPWHGLVLIGAMTATIGAGMQALAGGPRLLQAIGEDEILPCLKWFAVKVRGEPIRALMVTFTIAEIGVLIAFLDIVAPLVTMFFLLCYGSINFAVTLQSLLDTPHWRPGFRYFHWLITLFGTALCITTMFLSNVYYAILSLLILAGLHKYIEYKGAEKEWGDGMTGLSMSTAIYALNKLNKDLKHIKNWRPQVLTLLKMDDPSDGITGSGFSKEDNSLATFSGMLKGGKGLTMFGTIIKGSISKESMERLDLMKMRVTACLNDIGVKGFVEIVIHPNVSDGINCMIQSAGLGALRPNTIILGWPYEWCNHRKESSLKMFLSIMSDIALTKKSAIVVKADGQFPTKKDRLTGFIDIWWVVNDGGMMLLLATLLCKNKAWSKCKLRIFSVACPDDNTIQMKKDLEIYLYQLRLEGTVYVLEMDTLNIEESVYQRTIQMEERSRILHDMMKKKREKSYSFLMKRPSLLNVEFVFDKNRRASRSTQSGHTQDKPEQAEINQTEQPLREKNLKNMETAIRLNSMIIENSKDAELVIINLPSIPDGIEGQTNYMSFLEALTGGVKRILLVKGSGNEVITVYN